MSTSFYFQNVTNDLCMSANMLYLTHLVMINNYIINYGYIMF